MIKWLGKQIAYTLDTIAIKSKNIKIEDTIIIAGTPRSGTTLVMELLGWLPRYTTLFEPLHPTWFREAYIAGFQPRTYLPPGKNWPEGEKYLEKVLSGNVVSKNPYLRINPKYIIHRLLSNKIIVKFVRANRLLPWIQEKFNVRGTIFVIRHPCAVISSQLNTGFYGYAHPDYHNFYNMLPSQDQLMKEISKIEPYYPGLLEKVERLEKPEEILASIWSIDNLIPLCSDQSSSWYILVYEKLITEGIKELRKIFHWLREDVPIEAIKQLNIPSKLTQDRNPQEVTNKNIQLSKWKKISITAK